MTIATPSEASAELVRAMTAACERVAPTWPLDQFIAVNPYWGWRSLSAPETAARLGVLAGTALTMPRSWFREEWRAGRLAMRHVDAAAEALGDPELATAARAVLEEEGEPTQPTLQRLALVTDLRDLEAGPVPGRTWTDLVVHQIGQHCAAQFDEWQAAWAPDHDVDLFAAWRIDPSVTHGFSWRRGRDWARARLDSLPDTSSAAIDAMLVDLAIPPPGTRHT